VKKYVEKRLLKMFSTDDVLLMGKDTDHNSARSLTLLIIAFGWALCGRPQPQNASQWCHCCHFLR